MRIRFIVTAERVHVFTDSIADVEIETTSLPITIHVQSRDDQAVTKPIISGSTGIVASAPGIIVPSSYDTSSGELVQADILERVIRQFGTLSTSEIAEKAVEFGFETKAANLVNAVRKVLHREERFKHAPDGKRWMMTDGKPPEPAGIEYDLGLFSDTDDPRPNNRGELEVEPGVEELEIREP